MIELEKITLTLEGKVIFDHFSARVEKGEKVSISGSSGRGKTSLINMLLGYLQPETGKILIDDKPLFQNIHEIRKMIGWVPQNVNLPVKNGGELINLMQLSPGNKTFTHYLNRLGLDEKILYQDFGKVSGGQKQRIIISIVLALEKPIVLLDEPTSSLDEKSIRQLIQVIDDLEGITVMAATHNQVWLQHSDKVFEL